MLLLEIEDSPDGGLVIIVTEPNGHDAWHADTCVEPTTTDDCPIGHAVHDDDALNPVLSEYVPIGHSPSQWLSVVQVN